jgi:hypothetical protein
VVTETAETGEQMINSVLSGSGKFKQMRHFAMAGAVAVTMAGCATAPAMRLAPTAAPPQPLARLVVATPDADHDVMAQLRRARWR